MNKVKNKLPALVDEELAAAMEQHGPFASAHEGYAVLLEEVEEASEEMERLRALMSCVWRAARRDDTVALGGFTVGVARAAIDLAAEAIQVAAMARKIQASIGKVTP